MKRFWLKCFTVDRDTVVGMRPRVERIYRYQKPAQLGDGLMACDRQQHSVNYHLTDSLTYKIMDETFPNIHSVLISKNGCLVYEEYFYGWKAKDLYFPGCKDLTQVLNLSNLSDFSNADSVVASNIQ